MLIKTSSITAENYLAYERASDTKHEFLYNTLIDMAGASKIHNILCGNLYAFLWYFLRDTDNLVFQTDLRTHNPVNGSYFYPDIVVSNGEPQMIDNQMDTLLNPKLIVEILSQSTAVFDLTDKFIAYRSIPTLKEYVLVHSDTYCIDIYRKNDDETWSLHTETQLNKNISFISIGFSCKMSEVYSKVSI